MVYCGHTHYKQKWNFFCIYRVIFLTCSFWRLNKYKHSKKYEKIIFVEKNSMFLVRHIEPKNLVRLAWITRKFLKTENIFLNLEHSHTQKFDKYFFSIFKNFLLLHANLTKLIGSLCWTLNVTFFSTKHFSLACGQNRDFSYLRTLHVLSQDSRFTLFNKLKCLFFCHFFIVHWITTKVIGLVYLFSKIIMIFFK